MRNFQLFIFFVEKTQLQYADLGYWLIFPLTYAAYTMSHGKWTEFYPYEFTNVQALGLNRVLLNGLVLSISLLCRLLNQRCSMFNGFSNPMIGTTATDIVAHSFINVIIVGIGIRLQEFDGG